MPSSLNKISFSESNYTDDDSLFCQLCEHTLLPPDGHTLECHMCGYAQCLRCLQEIKPDHHNCAEAVEEAYVKVKGMLKVNGKEIFKRNYAANIPTRR